MITTPLKDQNVFHFKILSMFNTCQKFNKLFYKTSVYP